MSGEANIDERELIVAVAKGDRAAFKTLFDRHSPTTYNLCLRLLGNPDDAHEVAQDVFVTLWQKAASLRGESKLSTWLHRVAVNKSINFRKRGGLLSKLKQIVSIDTDEVSLEQQLPAPETDRPDRQLETAEARIELAELMANVPERQRTVYLLHKLEGLSYQEIAEQLNLTIPSIESLMHRAKENLQKAMLANFHKRRKKS